MLFFAGRAIIRCHAVGNMSFSAAINIHTTLAVAAAAAMLLLYKDTYKRYIYIYIYI